MSGRSGSCGVVGAGTVDAIGEFKTRRRRGEWGKGGRGNGSTCEGPKPVAGFQLKLTFTCGWL